MTAPMNILHPATEEEIQCIIAASPNKQCALDPFPTGLVKSCKDFLTPIIMQIVNKSLSTGQFPQAFKNALVTPLLKKRTLDEDVLNNYLPASNLAFISKITEKVVASRLNHHLMVNNLQEPFQSAYRMNHSTETAMLRVQNDIIRALGDIINGYSTLCMQSASPAKHSHGLRLIFRTVVKPLPSAANNLDLDNWSAACLKARSLDPSCSTYTLLPLASSFAKKIPTTQCMLTTPISNLFSSRVSSLRM